MAYIVRKKVKGAYYLHIHETKYLGCIGREDKLTKKEIEEKLKEYNIPYDTYLKKIRGGIKNENRKLGR